MQVQYLKSILQQMPTWRDEFLLPIFVTFPLSPPPEVSVKILGAKLCSYNTEQKLKKFYPSLRFYTILTLGIQADPGQSVLEAYLLQRGKPIAYASISLSQAECN